MNEAIVYLARKLHWTLKEIGELTSAQFSEILKEVQFQEAQEQYRWDYGLASILAAIANTVPRKGGRIYRASDFLSYDEPKKKTTREKPLEELAEEKGIKMPQDSMRRTESHEKAP